MRHKIISNHLKFEGVARLKTQPGADAVQVDGMRQGVYYKSVMNKELPLIRPCGRCSKTPAEIESSRPEGRKRDIYRVTCECGNGPLQWSVGEAAAIRLWNAYGAA